MVTVKISKRKRMRSKVYLKRSVPFFIVSIIIVVGGLLLISNLLKGKSYVGTVQWIWFIGSFLASQYINLKYVVEK
ncbi:MAG: hypothetical protein AMQ74_00752 [Candidatus Methanofastidiosum methylothiophilum]|uniref:Uncharacterized protein n=1 Tax=Candidatus Methanofastidiosum methylothiophilum TaxID=1705564 RepID=A0A150J5G4_9EURY|nr:MAG: hypothetical protein AMQ74_00752 [Candidatus Methanofastidiosum methylthiophilus]